MTIENWFAIATIITANILALATLLAPALAEIVKARLSQPADAPVTNQPKNRTHSIGAWFKRNGKPLAWLFILTLVNFAIIIYETRRPLDYPAVIIIALAVSTLTLEVVIVIIMYTFRQALKATKQMILMGYEYQNEVYRQLLGDNAPRVQH